ncbi:hypothetical protein EN794_051215 [Mesorhizobium sp. M00.F.Ca.ET.151.01.1.1]|uniref:hypothetical protein n=1 Tax=unclassified Mesorhizobium TaxID=325217 RepID=UPI000FD30833|nr:MULTISPECIES: hypothetical protein [unclassified Mesorhizobium]RVD55723.1 hypothetical protein EN746_05560 [Mesorhizobium sp. M8A.F.Ca.ET.023.02.2.1]TGR37717.1 hypothetical protein EN842_48845 [bacterium M00.F.Ca.ET.199.01.1.1]TGU22699.1 hypothetical protein EN799_51400 [bacterium M00.F.Ca.ET.156.01.1.1]TGU87386.1 hypothetical protein EN794_051215 [Mesorhizobium sp. M00.F.Ca.ET.151.01.1.1]TGV82909.1 hypothetical protein EN792_028240 [Mesorhizobium sp. M00.F.Ca.ET.149.01.1.1]
MATHPRYDGKPLLRLLELYVLKAIGELSEESEDGLKAMGPKLQAIYGGDGRWDDAIAKALHMPNTMPEAIRDMWSRNLKIAHDNNVTLTPQQFSEMFVDNNFAD